MYKFFLLTLISGFLFSVGFCLAVGTDPIEGIAGNAGYSTDVDEYSLSQTVGGIIKTVLGMVGVIFFALTFYAGYLWLTASGNDEAIEKAKGILNASVIGLVIILLSYGLTTLVISYATSASAPATTVGK